MKHAGFVLLVAGAFAAQAQAPKSFVGTVTGFRPESAEIQIRADKGDLVLAALTAETVTERVAPGAHDLKSAEPIKATEIAAGDRVLVTLAGSMRNVRRIVVMSADDISKRDEAERLDWQMHGAAGIVLAKSSNRITLKIHTPTGGAEAVIAVDERTAFKRYAPDSVRFRDARPSQLSNIAIGDQLWARGEKSQDGLQVSAQEVVFGTFLIKAGTITTVNPASREIALKELGTNKPLTIVLIADSQIKQMPERPAGMMGAVARDGIPPIAARDGAGFAGRGPAGSGRASSGGPPGGFDINEMIERLPPVALPDLRPGSTVIVSSTKGSKNDQLTAIMLVANADMLIQMASRASRDTGRTVVSGPSMGGMATGDPRGLANLDLSGMIMH